MMENKSKKLFIVVVISVLIILIIIIAGTVHRNNLANFNEGLKTFSTTSSGEVLIQLENPSVTIYNNTDTYKTNYKDFNFDIKIDENANKSVELLANQSDEYNEPKFVSLIKVYQKGNDVYINSMQVDDVYYKLDDSTNKGAIKRINNILSSLDSGLVNNEEITYKTSLPKKEKDNFYSLYDNELIEVTSYSINPDSILNPHIYMSNDQVVGERVYISKDKSLFKVSSSVYGTAIYDFTKWGSNIDLEFPEDLNQEELKDSSQIKRYMNNIDSNLIIESED